MISIIIPATSAARVENVRTITAFLKRQTYRDFEVILVEQIDAKLGDIRTGGPHYDKLTVDRYLPLRAKHHNIFSPAWMCNCGVKHARGNTLLFLDTDVVFDEKYLSRVSNCPHPFFFSFKKAIHLTEEATKTVRATCKVTKADLAGATAYPAGALEHPGYAPCAQKSFFTGRLGAYNENYLGWGGLDNDIAWRARHIMGQDHMLASNIYHMWHPRKHAVTVNYIMQTWRFTWKKTQQAQKLLQNRPWGDPNGPILIDNGIRYTHG